MDTLNEPLKHGVTPLSMLNNTSPSQNRKGYLLLEVTLALAITAILLTAVFQITNWNLKASQASIENSNAHIKESALFSFLDRAFLELSGDAIVMLTYVETADHYLSELTIQNGGEAFSWPNQPFSPKAVKIITKSNGDKTLDIILEYYTKNLLDPGDNRIDSIPDPDQTPYRRLTLLENVWRFEWRTWNGRERDSENQPVWRPEANVQGSYTYAPPPFLELNIVFTSDQKPIIHRIWSPRKVNPALHFESTIAPSSPNANENSQ